MNGSERQSSHLVFPISHLEAAKGGVPIFLSRKLFVEDIHYRSELESSQRKQEKHKLSSTLAVESQ
jgi:hypothetical protein